MRKNILTFVLGVTFVFLFAGSLVAEVQNGDRNSIKSVNSVSTVKNNNTNGKSLIKKYKKLTQNCATSADRCSDAYIHLAWAADYAYNGCNEYGWTSDYCQELGYWLTETSVWAIVECMPLNSTKTKPQKLSPINSGIREVTG